jgi:hypothetical protein
MNAHTVTEKFSAPRKIYGPNLFGGPARAAELLDVTEETVKRWMLGATLAPKDCVKVPRAAVLALYWETQYGRSQMSADLINEIQLLRLHIKIVEGNYKKAQDMLSGLRRIHAGTANEPYFEELRDAGPYLPNRHGNGAGLPLNRPPEGAQNGPRGRGRPPSSHFAAHGWKKGGAL